MFYSRESDFIKRSNVAGLHSANANTSEFEEFSKNSRVTLRHAASTFEENRPRAGERNFYDPKFGLQDSGPISRSFLSYTYDVIDASELTSLQLRNNFRLHDKVLMNMPKFTEKHRINSNKRLLSDQITGGLSRTAMRANSIDFATELALHLSKLEGTTSLFFRKARLTCKSR